MCCSSSPCSIVKRLISFKSGEAGADEGATVAKRRDCAVVLCREGAKLLVDITRDKRNTMARFQQVMILGLAGLRGEGGRGLGLQQRKAANLCADD